VKEQTIETFRTRRVRSCLLLLRVQPRLNVNQIICTYYELRTLFYLEELPISYIEQSSQNIYLSTMVKWNCVNLKGQQNKCVIDMCQFSTAACNLNLTPCNGLPVNATYQSSDKPCMAELSNLSNLCRRRTMTYPASKHTAASLLSESHLSQ
jgi:hypothetical protein